MRLLGGAIPRNCAGGILLLLMVGACQTGSSTPIPNAVDSQLQAPSPQLRWKRFDGYESFGGGGVTVRKRGMLRDGEKEGIWIKYGLDGRISSIATYRNGYLDGDYLSFDLEGRIDDYSVMRDGDQSGSAITYLGDGCIAVEFYKDDVQEGAYRVFYGSRQLKERGTMRSGKKNGVVEEWHANGVLKSRGAYRAGKKVGSWTYFDAKGNRIAGPRSAGK